MNFRKYMMYKFQCYEHISTQSTYQDFFKCCHKWDTLITTFQQHGSSSSLWNFPALSTIKSQSNSD